MPKSLPDPLPESVRSEVPGASPDFRTELAARLAERTRWLKEANDARA